jgi:uncharacterized YccA/Bax inhibitor family protein
MGLFKGGNPVYSEKTFNQVAYDGHAMTIQGTMQKFGIMLLMVLTAASFSWSLFYKGVNVTPLMWGSMIAGFIIALIITFKKEWAPTLSLGYAVCEGLFLGAISAVFDYASGTVIRVSSCRQYCLRLALLAECSFCITLEYYVLQISSRK